METNLALIYIKNGNETIFPVKDIGHAVRLADAIAESDLLDDSVDFNFFDACYFKANMRWNRIIGDRFEDEEGRDFEECWDAFRHGWEV